MEKMIPEEFSFSGQKIELVWNFIGEVNLPGDDQTVERQRKGRTA